MTVVAAMPSSWAAVRDRLAVVLGGEPIAAEWLRQALDATYGADHEALLRNQRQRALALQKAIGTMYALEDLGDGGMLPFNHDVRAITARVFARYWDGVVLPGPPWRLGPREVNLPAYEVERSDFDDFA